MTAALAVLYALGMLQAATYLSSVRDEVQTIPRILHVAIVAAWPLFQVLLIASLTWDAAGSLWRWVVAPSSGRGRKGP